MDEESGSIADKKAVSNLKSKRSGNKKRHTSKKKTAEKIIETEEIDVSEEIIEKKPRGRPKKSSKPIAANIETDAEDLVAKSDETGTPKQDSTETQATDGSETGVKRRRYRTRSRKNSNDTASRVSQLLDKNAGLGSEDNGSEFDDDPKKEIEAVSEIDDEQDIRRIRSPATVDIKYKK